MRGGGAHLKGLETFRKELWIFPWRLVLSHLLPAESPLQQSPNASSFGMDLHQTLSALARKGLSRTCRGISPMNAPAHAHTHTGFEQNSSGVSAFRHFIFLGFFLLIRGQVGILAQLATCTPSTLKCNIPLVCLCCKIILT